jgi:threonylcarbamoyladenosine tRNA methylthiotransferase MtaB
MRFFLKTYGCKVNQYETQVIREQLVFKGYQETDHIEDADTCIVNTCTVTAKADRGCREILRRIIRKNPKARVIAAGCYVEVDRQVFKDIDPKIETLGNIEKLLFYADNPQHDFIGITSFKNHTKAFIKVQDGCDNFCSYCKVPYVRGRSRSRDSGEIIREAKALVSNGYKELVLTGICLGDFGKGLENSTGLTNLIREISGIEADFRIRLSSIELPDATDELINEMQCSKKLCQHLHIPLQSGDDDILRKMNRRYQSADFLSRIEYVRSAMPEIGITTDIITGFPGESDAGFKNTIRTLEKIRPSRTHIFTYSNRPGTKAAELRDDLPLKTKKNRLKEIKTITDKFSQEFAERILKREQRVLVENTRDHVTGKLCGYTDNYVRVLINGPDRLMGNFIFLLQNVVYHNS